MQVELTDEQIKQVLEEWADIQRSMEARRRGQAEYTRYATFHNTLRMLGLLSLLTEVK